MQKPVRGARRFVRRFIRKKGKGKGHGKDGGKRSGKGKGGFYTFLAENAGPVEEIFKGSSGKGKGARKGRSSSGKGLGRSDGNPIGPDGKKMECWDCGSDMHMRGSPECPKPQKGGKSQGKGSYVATWHYTADDSQRPSSSQPSDQHQWHDAHMDGPVGELVFMMQHQKMYSLRWVGV